MEQARFLFTPPSTSSNKGGWDDTVGSVMEGQFVDACCGWGYSAVCVEGAQLRLSFVLKTADFLRHGYGYEVVERHAISQRHLVSGIFQGNGKT